MSNIEERSFLCKEKCVSRPKSKTEQPRISIKEKCAIRITSDEMRVSIRVHIHRMAQQCLSESPASSTRQLAKFNRRSVNRN